MTTPTTTAEPTDRVNGGEAITSAGHTLTVIAWRDPVVEQVGGAIRTDSD